MKYIADSVMGPECSRCKFGDLQSNDFTQQHSSVPDGPLEFATAGVSKWKQRKWVRYENGFVMNGSIAESARFIDWHHGDSGEQKDLLQSLYDCLHNILAIGEFAIFLR